MDSLQRSIPPNFISFCLNNQTQTEMLPDSSATFHSADNEISGSNTTNTVDIPTSTRSADSEPDINAYAQALVQLMESGRIQIQEELTASV